MLVAAIVGMAGAGKSELSRIFEKNGFARIRFGDITDEELRKQKLKVTEENERLMRESIRQRYGMDAYAKLNIPKVDVALISSSVVVDGLYSWEEYLMMSRYYHEKFRVVAVWSSPATRYARLAGRQVRPLTLPEAYSRDESEIMNLNKGGPIAMADFTVINESSLKDLEKFVKRTIVEMGRQA
ncbi:MAG: AAA family ATPase [Dehalococcoidia bacterium]|nr:AAA family ATPase [Dehalococcoidia bacterium]